MLFKTSFCIYLSTLPIARVTILITLKAWKTYLDRETLALLIKYFDSGDKSPIEEYALHNKERGREILRGS